MAAHKIAVLGAGNGGQALAGHLAMRGHDVSLYDIDREKSGHCKVEGRSPFGQAGGYGYCQAHHGIFG